MRFEVVRGEEKGILFSVREKDGREYFRIRRKKHPMKEIWEITAPGDETILAELCYRQKFIVPGCRINLSDGRQAELAGKMGLKGELEVHGCGMTGRTGRAHPFVLLKGEEEAAWISTVRPGEKTAYEMWTGSEDVLLCVAILTGYILCSRIGR